MRDVKLWLDQMSESSEDVMVRRLRKLLRLRRLDHLFNRYIIPLAFIAGGIIGIMSR